MNWKNKLIGTEKQVSWAVSIIKKAFSNVQDQMLEMGDYEQFKNTTFEDWANDVVNQYPESWKWINKQVLWAR